MLGVVAALEAGVEELALAVAVVLVAGKGTWRAEVVAVFEAAAAVGIAHIH